MVWKKGEKISTNLIVGFLGSGKTTAISKLIQQRPGGEDWSILINEFGTVSIDHALLGSSFEGVAVEELGEAVLAAPWRLRSSRYWPSFFDEPNPIA